MILSEQKDLRAESLQQPAKKPFVEPTVSVPVDVLDATTFFQTFTGGSTEPPPPPADVVP